MIERPFWQQRIAAAWREAPIAWLAGVRRAGKTTLAESLGGEQVLYLNCDLPSVEDGRLGCARRGTVWGCLTRHSFAQANARHSKQSAQDKQSSASGAARLPHTLIHASVDSCIR